MTKPAFETSVEMHRKAKAAQDAAIKYGNKAAFADCQRDPGAMVFAERAEKMYSDAMELVREWSEFHVSQNFTAAETVQIMTAA